MPALPIRPLTREKTMSLKWLRSSRGDMQTVRSAMKSPRDVIPVTTPANQTLDAILDTLQKNKICQG